MTVRFDPEAALRIWQVDLYIRGEVYTIPRLPAADWLMPVALGRPYDIVPGLLEEPDAFDDQLIEAVHTPGDDLSTLLRDAARLAITSASGVDWWTAVELSRALLGTSWVAGQLVALDATKVSFGAYLLAGYHAATKHMDATKQAQFDGTLTRPPKEVVTAGTFDKAAAAANFMAAMQAQGD